MSSSSAVIILTFLALAARNRLAERADFRDKLPTPELLCHYLGCIENGQDCGPDLPGDAGVGTYVAISWRCLFPSPWRPCDSLCLLKTPLLPLPWPSRHPCVTALSSLVYA